MGRARPSTDAAVAAVTGLPVRPLWWEAAEARVTRPSVRGEHHADVVIVGAGTTGLWLADYLTEHEPSLRVVVVEAQAVGYGASGRNGGWLSALLPMSIESMAATHPLAQALAMQRAMVATIDEVVARCQAHAIDADIAHGGAITLARSGPQEARLRSDVETAHQLGWSADDVTWLDAAAATARVSASNVRGAMYTRHCAAVHPAKLVRGLAAVVEAKGVVLFERSRVTDIGPGQVRTDDGSVSARFVIRATEAFTSTLPGERRAIAPVYSLMVATEPLSDELITSIGLAGRETFADARRSVIYGQRTADSRLAFGGRGAPYHFASSVSDRHGDDARVHAGLAETLVEMFPQLAGVRFTHRWGGAVGIARDWWCSVGLDQTTGMGWAGGYVGDGLATTNLAGRTLCDLILGRDSELTRLPWVGHRSPRWEPEPLRWLGINAATLLPTSIDRAEARTDQPARWRGWLLDRLAGG